ncbi:acetyl-CoA acyltransferase [Burkholderia sp. OAS925]|uniref:thiolase family protein n=1 Tax=Paraburkholderia TaxID=1822464 RepID=UPI00178ACBFD|nr:thiolase family protein [Paraburkholderia graminis]MDR6478871.1 acetyl-CoA acetyltransferase [Paraburkholderia graminis]
MSEAYIVGVGMTPLGKHWDKSVKQLTAQAVDLALADAGIAKDAIEVAWFCNTRQGVLEGQHNIRGQCALRAHGFERLPIFNTDNACASSSSGLAQAWAAVRSGTYDVALVVGTEKMNFRDKNQEMFEAFKGSWDRELADAQMAKLLAMGDGLPLPEEARDAGGQRSVFMDIYAAQARYHMARFGTTQRQIAEVAAKNHWHSQWNPNAQYREPMTADEVLQDKLISWPMTRSMCAPMSDGSGAIIVVSEKALQRFDRKRAIRIRGIGASSGSNRTPDQVEHHLTRHAALRAYEFAGLGPEDVSVAELHDASAFAEILQSENCGFAPYGDGGPLVESGATRLGGRLPINVSGGLLSKGHPIGATGAIQIHELVTQLRGEAGERQVANARIGLAENGGGFHGLEEAACVVTLLESPGKP